MKPVLEPVQTRSNRVLLFGLNLATNRAFSSEVGRETEKLAERDLDLHDAQLDVFGVLAAVPEVASELVQVRFNGLEPGLLPLGLLGCFENRVPFLGFDCLVLLVESSVDGFER